MKKTNYQYTLEEIEADVINNYCKNGYGLLKSGKKYGLTQNNVKYILKKYGIEIRNFSEATKISNENRALNKNENFFSKENENSNMAWVLGFLASDGTVRKNCNEIKIALAVKDEEILVKIKNLINIENNIHHYTTNTGFDVCSLSWTCKKHKDDLAKYGIIPNKTFILTPPINLNRQYYIDYIRGYFDGDGSINLIKNQIGNGSLRWQICSANKNFLQWIIDFLFDEYNIPKVKIYSDTNRKSPLYYFQYSSVATRKIYSILYTDSKMFLKRKKDHFEEILSIVKPLYE